jgi:dipeptidyl aminopeptidase/acylaminoacyl peptidase
MQIAALRTLATSLRWIHCATWRYPRMEARGSSFAARYPPKRFSGRMHTPPRQLSSAGGASKPCWSPDGKRIAYLSAGQIFVMSSGEEQPHLLTEPDVVVSSFLWSPDGRNIAFVGYKKRGANVLPPGVQIFTRADYRVGSSYPTMRIRASMGGQRRRC